MRKLLLIVVSAMLLSALCVLPVMADNYTGWSLDNEQVAYYVNGVKQTNVWVLKGNTLHYINGSGLLDNTQAVDVSAAPALGITNYITAAADVKYDVPFRQDPGDIYSAAKYIFNVKDDYEAFQYLYPQYKQTLTPDKLYEYYLSTYHNGDKKDKYLDSLDGYVDTYTNMCKYGYSYSPNYDGTHKSYCSCGKYIIADCACADIKEKNKGLYKCHYCGARYKFRDHTYHWEDDH